MRLVCVLFTFENNTGLTDWRTDWQTNTISYPDATAHLKNVRKKERKKEERKKEERKDGRKEERKKERKKGRKKKKNLLSAPLPSYHVLIRITIRSHRECRSQQDERQSLFLAWSAHFSIPMPRGCHWDAIKVPSRCHRCTMVENSQEYRLKYWATPSSVRSFARTVHSFARSLTSLTPSLVGQWMIGWLFILCFFLFWPRVKRRGEQNWFKVQNWTIWIEKLFTTIR